MALDNITKDAAQQLEEIKKKSLTKEIVTTTVDNTDPDNPVSTTVKTAPTSINDIDNTDPHKRFVVESEAEKFATTKKTEAIAETKFKDNGSVTGEFVADVMQVTDTQMTNYVTSDVLPTGTTEHQLWVPASYIKAISRLKVADATGVATQSGAIPITELLIAHDKDIIATPDPDDKNPITVATLNKLVVSTKLLLDSIKFTTNEHVNETSIQTIQTMDELGVVENKTSKKIALTGTLYNMWVAVSSIHDSIQTILATDKDILFVHDPSKEHNPADNPYTPLHAIAYDGATHGADLKDGTAETLIYVIPKAVIDNTPFSFADGNKYETIWKTDTHSGYRISNPLTYITDYANAQFIETAIQAPNYNITVTMAMTNVLTLPVFLIRPKAPTTMTEVNAYFKGATATYKLQGFKAVKAYVTNDSLEASMNAKVQTLENKFNAKLDVDFTGLVRGLVQPIRTALNKETYKYTFDDGTVKYIDEDEQ